jgi:regulator of RNase E activity RraA
MSEDLSAWKALSTATVSDALDRLGINGQAFGIAPLDRRFRLCGRAFTVKYVAVGAVKGTVGDYIDDVVPGSVVVLDNDGRLDATVWGDILTTMAHHRGIGGTVIHGVCRDVARSLELSYPMFSRGAYMRTGKDRVKAEAFNVQVSLGSVPVRPGDLLLGDADGVVVVPRGRESAVLEIAQQIEAAEDAIREAISRGERLDEARRRAGYFELQRRRDREER